MSLTAVVSANAGRGGFLGAAGLPRLYLCVCQTVSVKRSVNIHVSTRTLFTVKETSP